MFFFGAQRRSNANVSSWQRNMSNESPYTHYTVTRISKNGWVSDFISKHMYRLLREIFPCKTQDHILLLKKKQISFSSTSLRESDVDTWLRSMQARQSYASTMTARHECSLVISRCSAHLAVIFSALKVDGRSKAVFTWQKSKLQKCRIRKRYSSRWEAILNRQKLKMYFVESAFTDVLHHCSLRCRQQEQLAMIEQQVSHARSDSCQEDFNDYIGFM